MSPANWFGIDSIMIVVSDGEFGDSTQIRVDVHPVNDVLVISDLPDSVEFTNSENYLLQLAEYVSDTDLPDDSLRWQFGFDDDFLDIEFDDENWNLTLSAPEKQGRTNLIISVVDDSLKTAIDSLIIIVSDQATAIENSFEELPVRYTLQQNYPNPFNPTTTISFSLPKQNRVNLTVYNMVGQQMKVIINEILPAGNHTVSFDFYISSYVKSSKRSVMTKYPKMFFRLDQKKNPVYTFLVAVQIESLS